MKPKKAAQARFNVYVVRLKKTILNSKRFREANPQHDPRKPCVYVGLTGRTPEERFAQHRAGYKAARYVTQHGVTLIKRLYERYNPMTYEEAAKMEVRLAERLRRRGYAVWQN